MRSDGTLTRRQFVKAAGATLAAGSIGTLLGACSPTAPSTKSVGGGQVQLVYQDWNTDWVAPMAQRMLDQFHAEHPGIRVFYTPDPEDLVDSMAGEMEAGTAPDVFQGCCAHFPAWAQAGHVLDLRPFVEADLRREVFDDWDEAQYRSFFTAEGHQFGLPKYLGSLALFYNLDMFDAAGLPYPDGSWDHEDYERAMARLAGDYDGDGEQDVWGSMIDIGWDRLQVHVNGWDGHFIDPEDTLRCAMGDPEALGAFEWVRARMWDDRSMASFPDVGNLSTRDAFISGRVAMVEDGSWALQDILGKSPFRVGVAPFPAGPARRVTLASTDGFGIYAGTRYPEEAWELLKFLVSRDYGRAMATEGLLQPARRSLVDEWAAAVRERFPRQSRWMEPAVFADGVRRGNTVTTEIFASNMAEAQRIADQAWQRIFTLGQGSVDDMVSVARRIELARRGTTKKQER
jgi:multiple sugar transport system substrate-binding protein